MKVGGESRHTGEELVNEEMLARLESLLTTEITLQVERMMEMATPRLDLRPDLAPQHVGPRDYMGRVQSGEEGWIAV
ncbi:MAG: hypothetical protein WAN34_09265 [Acidimicrobiia bacterium]